MMDSSASAWATVRAQLGLRLDGSPEHVARRDVGHHEVLGQPHSLGSLARALPAEHHESDAVGHVGYFAALLVFDFDVVSRKLS